ncbi:hypothetical protein BLL52_4312 [Rhodoferax antarcticus ANT.BR]|uniref:SprT-like domain-containing protein n=2 Tax=Rhodoferax antarcticus TaxID=81479 RepID=A0A1Q8Y9H4_9BURK|nr:hypothetical protein BLL52_4312 [Rhodoferax antarcticus ANT.BR]
MRPMFDALEAPLPNRMRISIGFTSNGMRGRRIGECWDSRCSLDDHFEIFIRPDLAASPNAMPMQVAAILAHELVHAAIGIRAGHGPLFRRVAKGLGLQGKMTATVAGPDFEVAIAPILIAVGALPHGRLESKRLGTAEDIEDENKVGPKDKQPTPTTDEADYPMTTGPKRQTRRHIKCQCEVCGYTVRTSKKWLNESGPPICPKHKQMKVVDDGSSTDSDE